MIEVFGDWNTVLGWKSKIVEFVSQFCKYLLQIFYEYSVLGLCGEKYRKDEV